VPGHLVRMFENRNQKVILEENLGGIFPARKSRNRWKDQMEKKAATFFNTKKQHAPARHRGDLRKKTGANKMYDFIKCQNLWQLERLDFY